MEQKDRIELPTRGFSVGYSGKSKMAKFQHLDYIEFLKGIFAFIWNCLEMFDLDGHNLGTISPKPIEWIFTQLQPLTAPTC